MSEVIKEMQSDFRHKARALPIKLRDPRVKERFMKTTFFYPAYPEKEVPHRLGQIQSDQSNRKRMKISINYKSHAQEPADD